MGVSVRQGGPWCVVSCLPEPQAHSPLSHGSYCHRLFCPFPLCTGMSHPGCPTQAVPPICRLPLREVPRLPTLSSPRVRARARASPSKYWGLGGGGEGLLAMLPRAAAGWEGD